MPGPPPPLVAEAKLIADVLQGDRKAIADFIRQYSDLIFSFLCQRVDDKAAIEDLCQEVFLAAWSQLGNFQGNSSLKTWLCAIARHKAADHYRMQLRNLPVAEEYDGELDSLSPAIWIDVDAGFDRVREQQRIRETLLQLPAEYRAVLRWRYWDEQPLEQIAHETGRTTKSIERLLARARAHFAAQWKKGDHHAKDA